MMADDPQETTEEDAVKVVFIREDNGEKIEETLCLTDTVHTMKAFLSRKYIRPVETLTLSFSGETLSSATTLEQLGVQGGQEIQLHVQLLAPPTSMFNQEKPSPRSDTGIEYHVPNTFTVQVTNGEGVRKVLVMVDKVRQKKPFLGGFRHKVTGVEYHNASVQTLPKLRGDMGVTRFERDTQTVAAFNKYQQVSVDATTQMDRIGCYITDRTDRIVIPGLYETADQYHNRIMEKVIVLQSYWRRWLAKNYVTALRRDKAARNKWEKEEALRKQREKEERKQREFDRRMQPRTKDDFDLLYHALEMWRQDEVARINETTTGPERKAALSQLLEQEAQLIASIGRHKIVAGRESKEQQIRAFLNATAAPKKWIAFDGGVTKMDTPYTLRAAELRDLYYSVTVTDLSRDERLDVLLTLKATVREHDCKLTRDIVELVDREADLLVRDVPEHALEGLRKRIATLYLQYCKTPLFNAEAAKFIKVPQDPSSLRAKIYYCQSCSQYLPSTDFELSTNARVVGHCRQCRELDNKARGREDFTLYRAMIKSIRHSEEAYKDDSYIIFLFQEPDLRYLVENIWGCQSALSAEKDLFELTMVRWEKQKHWSPWNCVLLTKDEAQGHVKLDSPQEAYGAQFVQKVNHKHVLARNYFSRVPGMSDGMRSKVVELPLPRPKERVLTVRPHNQQEERLTAPAIVKAN